MDDFTQSFDNSTTTPSRSKFSDVFLQLLIGLSKYLELQPVLTLPPTLRRALNALAYGMNNRFPKTFYAFLRLCQHPVKDWFPFPVPDLFNTGESLMYDNDLSEEAQVYLFDLMEQQKISVSLQLDIPQPLLDNLLMVNLLRRLKHEPDRHAAQQRYVKIRMFLIKHSWVTARDLRQLEIDVVDEVADFYEDAPFDHLQEFAHCERCGILVWRENRWQGIKPIYCDDHGSHVTHVHYEPLPRNLRRLKYGIHLRTYLPGRAELRLFEWAEHLREEYPNELVAVEIYPGLDAYDLRLSFSDGDIWAIDVKDHQSPYHLATTIKFPYREGSLEYTSTYFVVPNARFESDDYEHRLIQKLGKLPPNLTVRSESVFLQLTEAKIKKLFKAHNPSRKTGKEKR